ncbi:MAG: hypothetical protein AAGA42_06465 [Actinomycetota bacterium]
MHDPQLLLASVLTVLDRWRPYRQDGPADRRDCGAVSIEQVLWYAAAAVSVAVVAAIIWSQVRSTASTPVQSPSAP